MKRVIFKIVGMHCVSCALNIDGALEEIRGIKEVNTSYLKQETAVTFEESLIDVDKISAVIKQTGYDVSEK